MKAGRWGLLLVPVIGVLATPVAAQVINDHLFRYGGGPLTYPHASSRPVVIWNPRETSTDHRTGQPGLHISFFGEGAGCARNTINGLVGSPNIGILARVVHLTGIPAKAGSVWSPTGENAQCDGSSEPSPGLSFATLNQDTGGGIGIFVYAGDGHSFGQKPFFGQYSAQGQYPSGGDKHIEGVYVKFGFDGRGGERIAPWSGNADSTSGQSSAVIRATVGAAAVKVGISKGRIPAQAQQNIVATFRNSDCMNSMANMSRTHCAVQYLFVTDIVREGVMSWENQRNFFVAKLALDLAQGGTPYIFGAINPSGQPTNFTGTTIDLWKSLGAESQHGAFGAQNFQVQIQFRELKSALALIAARIFQKPYNLVRDPDIAGLYGSHWGDPKTWILTDLSFAHEIYDENATSETFMGGNMKSIEVTSLPQ
jgi:hypothetical protein